MRHRIAFILICLLLGAIVNVGVAWSCAWWCEVEEVETCATLINVTRTNEDDGLYKEHWWILLSHDGAFGLRRNQIEMVLWATNDEDASTRDVIEVGVDLSDAHADSRLQQIPVRRIWWSRIRDFDVQHSYFGVDTEYVAGWPMPALWQGVGCDGSLLPPGTIRFSEAIGSSSRTLPLRPIWRGFAVNTMFYGALILLLLGGPLAIRHNLRQRRGKCVACAYDLRGCAHARCPECGAVTPAPSTASRTMAP